MATEEKQPQKVIIEHPAPPIVRLFQQQAFGPWSSNDPKIQRTIVRTRASSGITQRKFQATYPPPPTLVQQKTAITGGFEFTFNIVGGPNMAGYNIYSSTTNNPNIATLIQYQPQPPIVRPGQSIKIQDTTAAAPFYWVASVNASGKESSRVPMAGNPAPSPPPTQPLPSGGSSGSGSGGGRGGGPIGRGRQSPL